MKILVTGATGYVGMVVAKALAARGHEVAGLTRSIASDRAEALRRGNVRCLTGDIGAPGSYRKYLEDADAVVHTATDRARPVDADKDLFAELHRAAGSRAAPHLLYTTGCSVYGPHRHPILTETTPTDPSNARAGLENELRSSGLPHTIIRPAFVYGGGDRSSLLGRWLEEASRGEAVFYGRPEKVWSWVHVNDLAGGFAEITDKARDVDGEVFLFASQYPQKAFETFSSCQRAHSRTDGIRLAPIEDEDGLYRVFDRDEIVDSDKARRQLGWSPVGPSIAEHIDQTTSARTGRGH